MARHRRLYSIFEKKDGKWERLSTLALFKDAAVRHWQSILLGGALSGRIIELRVVKS